MQAGAQGRHLALTLTKTLAELVGLPPLLGAVRVQAPAHLQEKRHQSEPQGLPVQTDSSILQSSRDHHVHPNQDSIARPSYSIGSRVQGGVGRKSSTTGSALALHMVHLDSGTTYSPLSPTLSDPELRDKSKF